MDLIQILSCFHLLTVVRSLNITDLFNHQLDAVEAIASDNHIGYSVWQCDSDYMILFDSVQSDNDTSIGDLIKGIPLLGFTNVAYGFGTGPQEDENCTLVYSPNGVFRMTDFDLLAEGIDYMDNLQEAYENSTLNKRVQSIGETTMHVGSTCGGTLNKGMVL